MYYRYLNANIAIYAWPSLNIGEFLSRLRGGTIFGKLDLKDGHQKIPVAKNFYFKITFACI